MSTFNQTVVTPAATTRGLGNSSTATLTEMFPASPIYAGEVTDTEVNSSNGGTYVELLQEGDVPGSGGYYGFAPPFNRDFVDAPNIPADEPVGAAGLPATAYVPNPVPPGPGDVNPLNQPAPPSDPSFPNGPSDSFPSSAGGHESNPSATSANIASTTIGSYGLGTSGA